MTTPDFGMALQHGQGEIAVGRLVDEEFVGGQEPDQMVAYGGGVVHHQDIDEFIEGNAAHQGAEVVQAVG